MSWPLSFYIYRAITWIGAPLLRRAIRKRHLSMGANRARLGERFGHSTLARPSGRLIWLNAASLGELRATLALIQSLPEISFLVTTTSQSAADMAAKVLPKNAFHQFAPLDLGPEVRAFLNHWRPNLALFVESDLPLRCIDVLHRARIPLGLLNARPSRTRDRLPKLARAVLARMQLVTAQDPLTAAALLELGVLTERLIATCDLKALAPPQLVDEEALEALRSQIADRPFWLVMSAHPAECDTFAEAHRQLLRLHPDLLLILAPRHPAAADDCARSFSGLTLHYRSKEGPLTASDVYVADTLGEAGTLYALAPMAVIGGTFSDLGGHSPYEALQAGCPVVTGPFPGNHTAAFSAAIAAGAAVSVSDATSLALRVNIWQTASSLSPYKQAAKTLTDQGGDTLDHMVQQIDRLLK